MIGSVSSNTQVILLLTAPLIMRGAEPSTDLLPLGLYKQLVRQLRTLDVQPADLLASDAGSIISGCSDIVEGDRLRRLLGRGFLLSQVIERWQARAIWVISRADPAYPRRLKHWLREDAPPVLYGCGPAERLDDGGLAVVGSRHVDDAVITYTEAVGAMASRAGYPVVSGGAKGVDQAAMRGASDNGGSVVGVLADSLEKSALAREHRQPLMDGRLVLVSPYDPVARFNVGHAMQRNKLIYALADAALVVSSDVGKGGTWAGAIEQLDRFRFAPVYVRQEGDRSDGLDALHRKGALLWPEPKDSPSFAEVFARGPGSEAAIIEAPATDDSPAAIAAPQNETVQQDDPPAARLWAAVRPVVLGVLTQPLGEAAVAGALDVPKAQARAWLARLIDEGVVQKDTSKQYAVRSPALL
jgi:predicted Rossmann fold nucleotide-binding protein DprA/Smf involved in DNA uptake